ncbi:MAG: hypothetical protein ACR2J8_03735, partial [Thermomicrobiales bacterium]
MDQTSFDRLARLLGGAASRRQGLTAALGGALGLAAAAPTPAERDAAARARKRQPGVEGPCGDKSRQDNICDKDGDCCTGICGTKPSKKNNDRRGRCRCMQRGKPCTEDRNCCNTLVCINEVCGRPAPTPPACTVTDTGDAERNGTNLVAAIAAAADGATIDIEPGTYTADYIIEKNLTLVRCGDTGEVILMNYSEHGDEPPVEQGRVIIVGTPPTFKANPRGAGITVTLDTISVVANPDLAEGGGIYVSRGATLKLIGATAVRGSNQPSEGAGIQVSGGTLLVGCDRVANPACTDSVMIGDVDPARGNNNIGQEDGGGIAGLGASTIVIRGNAQVRGNHAVNRGGGILVKDTASLTITDDAKIHFNIADQQGGGLRLRDDSVCTLSGNALVADNTAA